MNSRRFCGPHSRCVDKTCACITGYVLCDNASMCQRCGCNGKICSNKISFFFLRISKILDELDDDINFDLKKFEIENSENKWPLIILELGLRLLISPEVGKCYINAKNSKLFKLPTAKFPSDYEVSAALELYFKELNLIGIKDDVLKIVKREKFQSIDCLKNDNVIKTNFDELVKKTPLLETVYDRQIKAIINEMEKDLGREIITPVRRKVCTEARFKQNVKYFLENIKSEKAKLLLEVFNENVKSQFKTITKEVLIQKTKAKIKEKQGQLFTYEIFLEGLELELIELIKESNDHSVLPDSYTLSPKDFVDEGSTYSIEQFLTHIRLKHLSSKRFIKNFKKKQSDFDGAVFCSEWKFDEKSNFSVIEINTISSEKKVLTSQVQYPYQKSDYGSLINKLKDFMEKLKLDSRKISKAIISILKKGFIDFNELTDVLSFKERFERFLTTFTYQLFATEVQRHPGALIHNLMALYLLEKNVDVDIVFKLLPMTIKGAVGVAREIQREYDGGIKYIYDTYFHNEFENDTLDKFIEKENDLIDKFKYYSASDSVVETLNKYSHETFGLWLYEPHDASK